MSSGGIGVRRINFKKEPPRVPFGCSQRYFCLAYKPALSQVRQEVLFVLEMKRADAHEK